MENKNIKWFLVQCFSGKELEIKARIEQKVVAEEMTSLVTEVYVPLKNKTNKAGDLVIKKDPENGGKMIAKAVKFSGYLFVRMDQTSDEAWFMVRNTEGVNGLIGSSGKGTKPTPVSDLEITRYKKEEENLPVFGDASTIKKAKFNFKVGEMIEVKVGSYEGKVGKVITIDPAANKVVVNLETFGRMTPTTFNAEDVKSYS